MTPEQMKELYATGEWICITEEKGMNDWCISEGVGFDSTNVLNYKLIHKKHSEVLDHVLNGGSVVVVNSLLGSLEDYPMKLETFIKYYDERSTYEIIKNKPILSHGESIERAYEKGTLFEKPSLNGHYCLATKEHYDKLVEDGYILEPSKSLDFKSHDRMFIYKGMINPIHVDNKYAHGGNMPMHLHNNEWVFGSLKHELSDYLSKCCHASIVKRSSDWYECSKCKKVYIDEDELTFGSLEHKRTHKLDSINAGLTTLMPEPYKPKPVERITREDMLRAKKECELEFNDHRYVEGYSTYTKFLEKYIKYLEANQKENK